MRLDVKAALLLLTGYVLLMAALAFGVDRWLEAAETEMTEATVRLLAREATAQIVDRIYAALETPNAFSRLQLRERIQDLVLLSESVSSVVVVDANGHVIASDDQGGADSERPQPSPGALFGNDPTIRAVPLSPRPFFRGGQYTVYIPLLDGNRLIGYFRVEFHSQRVERLYAHARRHLLTLALLGLAGVALLGLFLQAQMGRRAARITSVLNDSPLAPHGLIPRAEDEFSKALAAAGRVRQALNDAQRESSRLHLGLGALGSVMKMGVLLASGGSVEFANARALELFGVASPADLAKAWVAAQPRVIQAFRGQDFDGRRARTVDVRVDGENKPLRVEMYRLGGEDSDEYLILLNDPRILDALETDVRLASGLDSFARFYRTAAHDIKAPLSAVMINLDLLRETLGDERTAPAPSKEQQKHYVAVLREELSRLNRSLADLLNQTATVQAPGQRFDLAATLRELGALLGPQARSQGVDLALDLPRCEVPLVGHKDRLKQAFLNIVVNGLEAMPGGGRLDIRMTLDDGHGRISFRDNGKGIPPQLLERIYEADFTTKCQGSGIGLHVARTLVHLHGGGILVKSAGGTGTDVVIDLPLVPSL
jgi:two-component system, NtrC family, sensor histidine kinase HydH